MRVFLIAGEQSGDQLGGRLMGALRVATGGNIEIAGVGGEAMTREGLASLFPMTDIAVMGFLPVIRRLPTLLDRIRRTAAAVIVQRPDVLVLIDAPDFTHRVARRVRKVLPDLPVVDYVSPTVWAWRPGRARTMRDYVDHVLALLPFEPDAHRRLGGPDCTYVGHPLIERLADFRPDAVAAKRRSQTPPVLLVLPGSRRSEIEFLMPDFGVALARVAASFGDVEIILPAVSHLAPLIRSKAAAWPFPVRIVEGEAEKLAAFRQARAALAASGTVTLELALAGVPTVVAYKVPAIEAAIVRRLATAPSIVLPNLILGEKAIPEFLQEDCRPEALADAVLAVLTDGPAREAQNAAFARLGSLMQLANGVTPGAAAASIILDLARRIMPTAGRFQQRGQA